MLLTGCGVDVVSTSSSPTHLVLQGSVFGGSLPIASSHVYLYAANTTGYGGNGIAASTANASISLLAANINTSVDASGNYYVTTASDGTFSITGDYNACPSGSTTQVYLYAAGGNPGIGSNSALGLMAALGACDNIGPSTRVTLNEVSTIAAAYAFAGFASDTTHVSSSGTSLAQTGVANAFANATNLADLASGSALAVIPAGNGNAPQAALYTRGNILAACVNSIDTVSGDTTLHSAACSTLLSTATSDGSAAGAPPVDTATAAINIAHNPGSNITSLFKLSPGTPPFGPALASQPNDFTLGINFTDGGISQPFGIAIDSGGNAWAANYADCSITRISSSGNVISPATGYTGGGLIGVYDCTKNNDGPFGIAVDAYGNAWAPDGFLNSLTQLSGTGAAISPASGYTGGGLDYPYGIAIDGSGNVWIANLGNSISEFSGSGTAISPTAGYTGGGLSIPSAIAIDGSGNAWIGNSVGYSVTKFSSTGTVISPPAGYIGGGLDDPFGVAIDASGNAWVTNEDGNSVTKLSNSGQPLSPNGGYTGGGLFAPRGIAIDGSGNVWIANDGSPAGVTELASTGAAISPTTGYTGGGVNVPVAIAVDGSGNVWVANEANSVSELIGAAAPVVTPIAAGLPSIPSTDGVSNLGSRP